MRRLQDMSIGHRIALTLVIVLVILFALALFGYLSGRWDDAQAQATVPGLYDGVPTDATLLQLDRQALDEAYHAHLIKLWGVWLADGARDARRISNGLHIARQAYGQAAAQIAKREQQQQPAPRSPNP